MRFASGVSNPCEILRRLYDLSERPSDKVSSASVTRINFVHEFDPYTAVVFYLFLAQLLLLFVAQSLTAVVNVLPNAFS